MDEAMFQKLGDGIRRFMYGRYGSDKLNVALLILAAVLILLGSLGGKYLAEWMSVFNLLAYVPLVWSIVRMYSRNIEKRRQENAAFLRFFTRLKDRNNRYFSCPRCRQVVRVPRGRGRINIRCPRCAEQFIKKT